uniref:Apolipoprotein C-III n=1 Tax=Amazona collaria TaxID=241587 RepID=A0A8B9FAW9_9PSIT
GTPVGLPHAVCSALSTAMRVSLLLLLACTAVLAAQARADEPGEPEVLVRKVQEYAQKASAMAKSALSRVQESEVAQQARYPRVPLATPACSTTLAWYSAAWGMPFSRISSSFWLSFCRSSSL